MGSAAEELALRVSSTADNSGIQAARQSVDDFALMIERADGSIARFSGSAAVGAADVASAMRKTRVASDEAAEGLKLVGDESDRMSLRMRRGAVAMSDLAFAASEGNGSFKAAASELGSLGFAAATLVPGFGEAGIAIAVLATLGTTLAGVLHQSDINMKDFAVTNMHFGEMTPKQLQAQIDAKVAQIASVNKAIVDAQATLDAAEAKVAQVNPDIGGTGNIDLTGPKAALKAAQTAGSPDAQIQLNKELQAMREAQIPQVAAIDNRLLDLEEQYHATATEAAAKFYGTTLQQQVAAADARYAARKAEIDKLGALETDPARARAMKAAADAHDADVAAANTENDRRRADAVLQFETPGNSVNRYKDELDRFAAEARKTFQDVDQNEAQVEIDVAMAVKEKKEQMDREVAAEQGRLSLEVAQRQADLDQGVFDQRRAQINAELNEKIQQLDSKPMTADEYNAQVESLRQAAALQTQLVDRQETMTQAEARDEIFASDSYQTRLRKELDGITQKHAALAAALNDEALATEITEERKRAAIKQTQEQLFGSLARQMESIAEQNVRAGGSLAKTLTQFALAPIAAKLRAVAIEQQIDAIAAFASYDFVGGALHEAAALAAAAAAGEVSSFGGSGGGGGGGGGGSASAGPGGASPPSSLTNPPPAASPSGGTMTVILQTIDPLSQSVTDQVSYTLMRNGVLSRPIYPPGATASYPRVMSS